MQLVEIRRRCMEHLLIPQVGSQPPFNHGRFEPSADSTALAAMVRRCVDIVATLGSQIIHNGTEDY